MTSLDLIIRLRQELGKFRMELERLTLFRAYESTKRQIAVLEELYVAGQRKGSGQKKKINNCSWAAEKKRGDRTSYIYDLLVSIVKEAGGRIGYMEATRILCKKTGVTPRHARISHYVLVHDKKQPEASILELWPKRSHGNARVRAYHTITLRDGKLI